MKLTILLSTLLLIVFSCGSAEANSEKNSTQAVEEGNSSSRILFARKRIPSEGWTIFSVNSDGSDEKTIIPAKRGMGEYNPARSPDGKTILFNTYRYGGWKLATRDLASGKVSRITQASNYFTNGVYSADGEKIAYEKNIGRSTHICIADVHGKNEVVLTSKSGSAENRIPVWTANGESIIFYNEKNSINDIFSIDIASLSIQNLTKNSTGNDFSPAVSPDGKQIAFFSDRNGFLDLYIMDRDGSNPTNLSNALQSKNNKYNYFKDSNTYWIFKVAWSPDGKHLVFSNVKTDNVDLFTIKSDGTELTQITKTSASEYTPCWN